MFVIWICFIKSLMKLVIIFLRSNIVYNLDYIYLGLYNSESELKSGISKFFFFLL